jgi:hypothetical protein
MLLHIYRAPPPADTPRAAGPPTPCPSIQPHQSPPCTPPILPGTTQPRSSISPISHASCRRWVVHPSAPTSNPRVFPPPDESNSPCPPAANTLLHHWCSAHRRATTATSLSPPSCTPGALRLWSGHHQMGVTCVQQGLCRKGVSATNAQLSAYWHACPINQSSYQSINHPTHPARGGQVGGRSRTCGSTTRASRSSALTTCHHHRAKPAKPCPQVRPPCCCHKLLFQSAIITIGAAQFCPSRFI